MVDESFRIKTFSSNELENAKRKIAEAKRIKREESDLRRRGGIFAANTEEGDSRRTSPRQKQSAKVKPITKDRTSKAAFTKTNEFKKLQTQTNSANAKIKELTKKQKEFEEKFFDKLGSAGDIVGDLSKGASGVTGALGKLGPIGLIIASIIGPILAISNESLERGGVFSTKLPVTKDTLTVNDIEELADVTSGTKYLTSDLTVAQRAPSTSNTSNLKYEHVRYVVEDVGRG